jgi:hypothetical protein
MRQVTPIFLPQFLTVLLELITGRDLPYVCPEVIGATGIEFLASSGGPSQATVLYLNQEDVAFN